MDTLGTLIGVAGLTFAGWREWSSRRDRSEAVRELNQMSSQLSHLEWWVHNNPRAADRASLANQVTSQVHSMQIQIKGALERNKGEQKIINPFPDQDGQGFVVKKATMTTTVE
jgi:hypothetical protein